MAAIDTPTAPPAPTANHTDVVPDGDQLAHAYCTRCRNQTAACGHEHQDVTRFESSGVPDVFADRWATRLGFHPVQVWGWAWVDAGLTAHDRRMIEGNGWRPAWLHNEPSPTPVTQENAA